MVCLDSDVLINFLRKDVKTIRLFENLKLRNETLSITSINSFELIKGIPKSSHMNQAQVFKFLNNFKVYDFNFNSSKISLAILKSALLFESFIISPIKKLNEFFSPAL